MWTTKLCYFHRFWWTGITFTAHSGSPSFTVVVRQCCNNINNSKLLIGLFRIFIIISLSTISCCYNCCIFLGILCQILRNMSFLCICIKGVSFLCNGVSWVETNIVTVLYILIEFEQICCSLLSCELTQPWSESWARTSDQVLHIFFMCVCFFYCVIISYCCYNSLFNCCGCIFKFCNLFLITVTMMLWFFSCESWVYVR